MEEREGQGEAADLRAVEGLAHGGGRRSPGWRGWVLSILLAVALSVTATLLLGGSVSFQPEKAAASGASGSGCGSGTGCGGCSPADAGK
jgi:hypothetical protein